MLLDTFFELIYRRHTISTLLLQNKLPKFITWKTMFNLCDNSVSKHRVVWWLCSLLQISLGLNQSVSKAGFFRACCEFPVLFVVTFQQNKTIKVIFHLPILSKQRLPHSLSYVPSSSEQNFLRIHCLCLETFTRKFNSLICLI